MTNETPPGVITCNVFRYDPSTDDEGYYSTYEVPWRREITVLEVLRYIYENYEPLSFESNCRMARCGMCGVKVNGRPVLGCKTVLSPGPVTIEPLDHFEVIRDLVVDRSEVIAKTARLSPWLLRSEPLEEIPEVPFDAFSNIMRLQYCFDCQICFSACPVVGQPESGYAGPESMLKLAMRYYDPRDQGSAERIGTAVKEGLFNCLLCGTCEEVCPVGSTLNPPEIEHLPMLKDLRKGAVDHSLAPSAIAKLEGTLTDKRNVYGLHTDAGAAINAVPNLKVKQKAEIVYFTGCTARSLSRARGQVSAIAAILDYLHEDWTILQDEWCCGHPLNLGGIVRSFEEFVKHNVDAIRATGAKTVITGCPACRQTFLEDYPKALKDELGFKVIHISEFLSRKISEGSLKAAATGSAGSVTYHDPCQLGRIGGILEEPRHVITSFSRQLLEPAQTGREGMCCGYGGLLNSTNHGLAEEIADKTFSNLTATGSSVVVTACPSCELAMKGAAGKKPGSPKVMDISVFVATQLGLQP
jgi:succinate dehydrogenase/fumarate reductase iron-sulfur protein